jgi:rRNA maturation endonuclease Nob1
MESIIAGLLFFGVLVFLLMPLLGRKSSLDFGDDGRLMEQLEYDKENIYQQIKELEFDLELGNITQDDFQELSTDLKAQAAEVLMRIDATTKKKGMKVEGKRKTMDQKFCQSCGEQVTEHDKFCHHCGQSLSSLSCPFCGSSYSRGDKFCSQCGKGLVAN